jgi:hypothetical protein
VSIISCSAAYFLSLTRIPPASYGVTANWLFSSVDGFSGAGSAFFRGVRGYFGSRPSRPLASRLASRLNRAATPF